MPNKFNKYLFRCSSLGKIVSASGKFTDGNKTYLQELFIGETCGTRRAAYGRALEKGVHCEEDGITMLNKTLYKGRLLLKNKTRKRNDFIHGECDVFIDDTVFDIKNAYDLFTFGKANLSHDYTWQVVGYAWLWNVPVGKLFYCINNMPEHLLMEEERLLYYKNKWKYISIDCKEYIDDVAELRRAHNYDRMPIAHKFKVFEVDGIDEKIEQLKEAIDRSREYLNKLDDEHEAMIAHNIELMKTADVLV